MADVNRGNRPLSPHLSIYNQSYTGTLSILHRATGVAIAFASFLVVGWFLAASSGAEQFAFFDGLLNSWLGGLIMIGALFSLWYHFCNGIRHLYWDTGRGFELESVSKSGVVVIAASAMLTVITLVMSF